MLLMIALGVAFFAGLGALTSLRVLREYERAIVFRLGRARQKALGPGVVLMLPFGVDRATVVDTRTKVIQIPTQEVITRDNISIGVDAVVYIEIASPLAASRVSASPMSSSLVMSNELAEAMNGASASCGRGGPLRIGTAWCSLSCISRRWVR